MSERWQLRVFENDKLVYEADLAGTAKIGRQRDKRERAFDHRREDNGWRVVIAPLEETTISRGHLEVQPLPDSRFRVVNLSASQDVMLPDGRELKPGASQDLASPTEVRLGTRRLRLVLDEDIQGLPEATVAPGRDSSLYIATVLGKRASAGVESEAMVPWLRAFVGVLQGAAGSLEFFVRAARALVDLLELDTGRVLLRQGQDWQVQAAETAPGVAVDPEWRPSRRILNRILQERRTFWQVPEASQSIQGIDAMVAAPILDGDGDVLGALCGERRLGSSSRMLNRPITRVEAMLVDVLASGVAAGLARVEEERKALQARLQMEQFFTARLAAKLVDRPELLEGRETEVTVLVCDIRGFSRISEKLGPTRTVGWISDVLSTLSQCVLDEEGVVVDYIGDEMMAMWGAPEDQPDQAARACRAALAMLGHLPPLNAEWQPRLRIELGLGIGINSGIAQVGNVGSRVKFKYGPLGNTVNLASRVQGATKILKSSLLITEATQAQLDNRFVTRRLCQVRVVNIDQPVTLLELTPAPGEPWQQLKKGYEEALEEFNNRRFREACRILGRLIPDHPDDGPALILLSRAVACLVEEPEPFDPVWQLPGK